MIKFIELTPKYQKKYIGEVKLKWKKNQIIDLDIHIIS